MKARHKHTVFNFWKENKTSGFFQLTEQELIKEFNQWLPTKEVAWLEYYSTTDVVSVFVQEALTAIGNTDNDFEEYKAMEDLLKPIKRKFIDKQKHKNP